MDKGFYRGVIALSITYFGTAILPVFEKIIFLVFGVGFISSYNYAFLLLQVPLQVISAGVIAVAWTGFMESLRENNHDDALDGLYDLSLNAFIVSCFVAMCIFSSNDCKKEVKFFKSVADRQRSFPQTCTFSSLFRKKNRIRWKSNSTISRSFKKC